MCVGGVTPNVVQFRARKKEKRPTHPNLGQQKQKQIINIPRVRGYRLPDTCKFTYTDPKGSRSVVVLCVRPESTPFLSPPGLHLSMPVGGGAHTSARAMMQLEEKITGRLSSDTSSAGVSVGGWEGANSAVRVLERRTGGSHTYGKIYTAVVLLSKELNAAFFFSITSRQWEQTTCHTPHVPPSGPPS